MAYRAFTSTSCRGNCRYFFDRFLSEIEECHAEADNKAGGCTDFFARLSVIRPENAHLKE
jgi:hypothetical protein